MFLDTFPSRSGSSCRQDVQAGQVNKVLRGRIRLSLEYPSRALDHKIRFWALLLEYAESLSGLPFMACCKREAAHRGEPTSFCPRGALLCLTVRREESVYMDFKDQLAKKKRVAFGIKIEITKDI